MNQHLFAVIVVPMMVFSIARSTVAQTPAWPIPDGEGNYFSNETPVQGTVPSPRMGGSLWQVVASELNCRSNMGMQSAIVRQFKPGEVLQADVGRGGADEVRLNAKDATGKPWLRVRSQGGQDLNCYVRANRRYIQPYRGK